MSNSLIGVDKTKDNIYIYTFAVVVGLEDDEDVFKQGDEDDGVEDEGEDAEDVVVVADAVGEGARIDVERRGTDVPVHHADALEGKAQYHRPPNSLHDPFAYSSKYPTSQLLLMLHLIEKRMKTHTYIY